MMTWSYCKTLVPFILGVDVMTVSKYYEPETARDPVLRFATVLSRTANSYFILHPHP